MMIKWIMVLTVMMLVCVSANSARATGFTEDRIDFAFDKTSFAVGEKITGSATFVSPMGVASNPILSVGTVGQPIQTGPSPLHFSFNAVATGDVAIYGSWPIDASGTMGNGAAMITVTEVDNKPPVTKFRASTAMYVDYAAPWVQNNLEASPGETILFNIRAIDKDQKLVKGSKVWATFDGTGPYKISLSVSAGARFSGAKQFNSLDTGKCLSENKP